MDKQKSADNKGKSPAPAQPTSPRQDKGKAVEKSKEPATGIAGAPPLHVPPLFRQVDWLTFAVTTLLVFLGYFWTLAPDLTLEDSGELAVASHYAGVPHPPGYPVWSIFTWLFSVLVPVSNVAYRVALFSALSGALSCGLLALIVSRGSSMMIESVAELKKIEPRLESAVCFVSGFVAGMLLGFNGFMWSQAVIVEVYTFSHLSFLGVLCCLLRWIYAPHQRRYLYWAFFLFGICFTNHQSLLLAAMGIEVAVIAAYPRFGRDLVQANSIVYIAGLIAKSRGYLSTLETPTIFIIYNFVGISSLAAWVILAVKTKLKAIELGRDFLLIAFLGYLGVLFLSMAEFVTAFQGRTGRFILFNLFGIAITVTFFLIAKRTWNLPRTWLYTVICGGAWILGAAFYLFMPLTSMTNPPLNWGYPRTEEGFFHALSRGQYERTNPTDIMGDPKRFVGQLIMYFSGTIEEFNVVYFLIGLIPFFFFLRLQKRERAWLIGVVAIFACLSVLLLIMLNPSLDRQSRELVRVFFTASHVLVSMLIGYGLTFIAATLATQYERFRLWALSGAAVASAIALYCVSVVFQSGDASRLSETYILGLSPSEDPLIRFTAIFSLCMAVAAVLMFALSRQRLRITPLLVLFAIFPVKPMFTNWSDNEQRGHYFGYWFGHDMFTPPFTAPDGTLSYDAKLRAEAMKDAEQAKLIYPEMARDAILFGGTDPGRFCPTYMIFSDSFIPPEKKMNTDPHFDRRDVYIITQNALADGTYLAYIRAHYNRSAQIDPPFFQEMLRSKEESDRNYKTNFLARMVLPLDKFFLELGDRVEKRRRAGSSYFDKKDFLDLPAFAAKLRPSGDQDSVSKFVYENLSPATQEMLSKETGGDALANALARDLNVLIEEELNEIEALEEDLKQIKRKKLDGTERERLINERKAEFDREFDPFHNPERFKGVELSEHVRLFIKENPQSHTRIRLNRLLLEEAYPERIAKSPGGVYPDREILTPTIEDSQTSFSEYMADAQRRLQLNQLKPGEDVRVVGDPRTPGQQRVQVSGQVAVMAINGLLTKVIFDKNPGHEFYVEESFPLDWMFPHLSPFGIIMKINREPLPEIPEEMVRRDHEFWSRYSDRLIGNWITYDTSLQEIADFVEKVYLRRDYTGFKGDRKFVRDDQAQKAFSKLRSSIGGIYNWRISHSKTTAEQQRMIKEADFTFKQAFAFCPYSPEAVYRYVNLLMSMQRFSDALIVASTCLKMDPYNPQVGKLVKDLEQIVQGRTGGDATADDVRNQLAQMEAEARKNPTNFQNLFNLASAYLQLQQSNRAMELLDMALTNPAANVDVVLAVAQAYVQLNSYPKLEMTLERLVQVAPDRPEAWYDLAAMKATVGKQKEALDALGQAIKLSNERLKREPAQRNLAQEALKDPRFATVRQLPEFKDVTGQP